MARPINKITTYCELNHKSYELILSPIEEKDLEQRPNFAYMKKIDMNVFGYYFLLTEEQYRARRQLQREKIHRDVLDRVYDKNQDVDIDLLNDEVYLEDNDQQNV